MKRGISSVLYTHTHTHTTRVLTTETSVPWKVVMTMLTTSLLLPTAILPAPQPPIIKWFCLVKIVTIRSK